MAGFAMCLDPIGLLVGLCLGGFLLGVYDGNNGTDSGP